MDDQREKDIKEVCKVILDTQYKLIAYDEGAYGYIKCRYCEKQVRTTWGNMLGGKIEIPKELRHDLTCPTLIAKDLLT